MDTGSVIISVLTVVVIAGIIFAAAGGGSTSTEIEGLQEFERTDRTHTQESVAYQQTPPVGGAHNPTWLDCNAAVYENPVNTEKAVHALEHGAVWISYEPDTVATSSVKQLQSYLGEYTFLSPVPGQGAPIKLSAWGKQLAVESPNDPRIQQFLDAFRQGPQTPEPGASCESPDGPMERDKDHEHKEVDHDDDPKTDGDNHQRKKGTSSQHHSDKATSTDTHEHTGTTTDTSAQGA